MQESQWKQIRLVEGSRPANFKHHFHCWCKQITMWCKSLTLEKYISFRMKWFFWPPFLSVSPFLLLNLVRRQCHAYAIGLYTRPEIKSWPDVKFFAHAQCVLPRCWYGTVPHLKVPVPHVPSFEIVERGAGYWSSRDKTNFSLCHIFLNAYISAVLEAI